MNKQRPKPPSALAQILVNFVLPIIVLTKYSGENQLGPTKGMLLALAFPVVYELFSIQRQKKISLISVLSIGGILVTGLISLLGLSEGWLALRRSIPYAAAAIAFLVSVWIKHPILNAVLAQVLDMEKLKTAARQKGTLQQIEQTFTLAAYLLSGLLAVITVVNYLLTRMVIMSPTGTTTFNQEYAHLRIVSLPVVTLPVIIGIIGILFYVILRLEKLSGISSEELIKKK